MTTIDRADPSFVAGAAAALRTVRRLTEDATGYSHLDGLLASVAREFGADVERAYQRTDEEAA